MIHTSVLLHEAIDSLDIHAGDIVVDGTLGGGGHTEAICAKYGDSVRVIGIDLDPDALDRSRTRLEKKGYNVTYILGSFRNIDTLLDSVGQSTVDRVLLDIGLSSNQFEDSGRGFSFQKDEPLIMSFKKDITPEDLTAGEIVNTWDEENLRAILEGYGEEQFAYKIAKAIVRSRTLKKIETTFELVDIINSATPHFYHHRRIHPATKTFQALRITVNDEIESLKDGIRKSFDRLNNNGRLSVISFHSLEDRVVKQFFNEYDSQGVGKKIYKKPVVPTDEEIEENPRSRSAKLRTIQKINIK